MIHFLKDQMKCKSDPSFYQLLIEKSQIWGKKSKKTFFTKRNIITFYLKWRNKIFLKMKIFYQTLSLTLLKSDMYVIF